MSNNYLTEVKIFDATLMPTGDHAPPHAAKHSLARITFFKMSLAHQDWPDLAGQDIFNQAKV